VLIRFSLRDDGDASVAPTAFLGPTFGQFKSACDRGGAVYDGVAKSQRCTIAACPRVAEQLRASGFQVEVDEDLARVFVDQERANADAESAASKRIEAIEAASGKPLFPYQKTGIAWLSQQKSAILGDDMGLGKTVQACVSIPEGSPTVVICPSVAKSVWQSELALWRSDLRVTVVGSRSFRWPEPGEVVVVNYEVLPVSPSERLVGCDVVDSCCLQSSPTKARRCVAWRQRASSTESVVGGDCEELPPPSFSSQMRDVDDDFRMGIARNTLVIADEFHRAKARDSRVSIRTAAVMEAARDVGGRSWGLTATPLLNRAPELWALTSVLGCAAEVFGSWKSFSQIMGGIKTPNGWEWAATPGPEAHKRIRRVMLRREKREVLRQLPAKRHRDITVEVDPKYVQSLDDVMRSIKACGINLDDATLELLAEKVKFETLSRMRSILALAKIHGAIAIIEEYEAAREPVVLFSVHRGPVDVIGRRHGWAAITGSTKGGVCDRPGCLSHRGCIAGAFQRNELLGIAGTIDAAGTAITLTRSANVVFVDRDWTPELNVQAEDRCYRIGQTRGVLVTNLVADHPIEKRVELLLRQKRRIIAASVGAASVGASAAGETLSSSAASSRSMAGRAPISDAERDAVGALYAEDLSWAGEKTMIADMLKASIEANGSLTDQQWQSLLRIKGKPC
jgi:SWI/SNF-related matrix-associated actin-dependent regulator 1 of chromatin subfamily A